MARDLQSPGNMHLRKVRAENFFVPKNVCGHRLAAVGDDQLFRILSEGEAGLLGGEARQTDQPTGRERD